MYKDPANAWAEMQISFQVVSSKDLTQKKVKSLKYLDIKIQRIKLK